MLNVQYFRRQTKIFIWKQEINSVMNLPSINSFWILFQPLLQQPQPLQLLQQPQLQLLLLLLLLLQQPLPQQPLPQQPLPQLLNQQPTYSASRMELRLNQCFYHQRIFVCKYLYTLDGNNWRAFNCGNYHYCHCDCNCGWRCLLLEKKFFVLFCINSSRGKQRKWARKGLLH